MRSFQVFRQWQKQREKETGEPSKHGRRLSDVASAALSMNHKSGFAAVHSKVSVSVCV